MTTVNVDRSWRSYVERCGTLTAGSQRVVLPVLLVLSFGTIPRWAGASSETLSIVIAGVGISAFASWLLFTLGALLIRAAAPRIGLPRGISFLVLYGLVESTRAVTLAVFFVKMHISTQVDWAFEITAGFTTGLVLFATMSLFLGDAEQYRGDMRTLIASRERLKNVLSSIEKDIQQRREELLASVREVVAGAVASVLKQRESGSPADTRLVAELNRISSDVVRPLSHSMFGLQAIDGSLNEAGALPKVKFTRVATIASTISAFRPVTTMILIVLIIMPAVIFRTQLVNGVLTVVAVAVWTLGFVWIAQRLLLPRIRSLFFPLRAGIIWAVYALYTVGLFVAIIDTAKLEVPVSFDGQVLYGIVLGVPLMSVIAITPATRQARAEVLAETASTNKELSWMTARLGAELWADRRSIAKTLHQDVQGVLVAAAFRLQRAIDKGQDIDIASDEVFEIVSMAANFAIAPAVAPTMDHSLEQLRDRWGGILEIAYDADVAAAQLLAEDRVARQLMHETISEFAINSVKHGLATEATITVRSFDPRLLSIVLMNNGGPIDANAIFEGLGSRMMSTMGINGTYENVAGGGVSLRAQIPVDTGSTAHVI